MLRLCATQYGQFRLVFHTLLTAPKSGVLPDVFSENSQVIENGKAYVKSTAALRASRHLSGGWPLLYGFIIIPAFIRNAVYDFIAKNRYKWYGKKDSCMIPTAELKAKFL